MPPAAPMTGADRRPLDSAIFIGGMPRSGTSLMRVIVGLHPDVAMFPGELPLWRQLARAHADRDLSRPDARDPLIRDLLGHPRMKRARVTLDRSALVAALAAEPVVTFGTVLAHALRQYAHAAGKPHWGVKDPRTEFYADRLFAELPAARVVHMVRDPRDVLASQRAMWGRRAQHVVSTIDAWRRSATLALRQPALRPGAYVAVRYEDLVAEPARVVRELCRGLGLDYRPEMLDVAGQPLWLATDPDDPKGATPAEVISSGRVGRHRAQLRPGEIRYVERRARREMAAWGYAPATPVGAGDWVGTARCLAAEGAWWTLRRLRVWRPLSRALGRLPPGG